MMEHVSLVLLTSLVLLWAGVWLYISVSSLFDILFKKDFVIEWFGEPVNLNVGYWYKAPLLLLAIMVVALFWMPIVLFYSIRD